MAIATGAHRLDRGQEVVTVHRSPRHFRLDLPPGQTQSAQSCPLCSPGDPRGVEQCSWASPMTGLQGHDGDRPCMSCRCARRSPAWSGRMPTAATSTSYASGSARFGRWFPSRCRFAGRCPRLRGHARSRVRTRTRHRRGELPLLRPAVDDHVAVVVAVRALRERRRQGAARQRVPGDVTGRLVKGIGDG